MSNPTAPIPTELTLRKRTKTLVVTFQDGISGELTAEYLRVHSPSAEVTGHGVGEAILVTGKESVGIEQVEPVGRYAVRLVFSDGHNSGLYTWKVLYDLCRDSKGKWQRYLDRLRENGHERHTTQ